MIWLLEHVEVHIDQVVRLLQRLIFSLAATFIDYGDKMDIAKVKMGVYLI